MMPCYGLFIDQNNTKQSDLDTCFIGGKPRIPIYCSIPKCKLCHSQLTFFFQIEHASYKNINSLSTALFACTKCANENFLIPKIINATENYSIPYNFLVNYQINFRFLTFFTNIAKINLEYKELIAFRRWIASPVDNDYMGTKIGGNPTWILGDETPTSYADKYHLEFLMQVEENFKYLTLPDAPKQVNADFLPANNFFSENYYELFIGNSLYLFSTISHQPLIYAIVQGE